MADSKKSAGDGHGNPASQGNPPPGKAETTAQPRAEDWGERDAVGEEIESGGKGGGQRRAKREGE